MKITLSREEIKELVATHYGLNADFLLEISSERASAVRNDVTTITTVNSNNQVVDIQHQPPVIHSDDARTDSNTVEHISAPSPDVAFKKCEVCGKKFIPKTKKVRTCSKSCRSKLIYNERKAKTGEAVTRDAVDYEKYGIIIEDFLNSSDSIRIVDRENLSLNGILYRYRKASKLFNFEDKLKFSKEDHQIKMVKEY